MSCLSKRGRFELQWPTVREFLRCCYTKPLITTHSIHWRYELDVTKFFDCELNVSLLKYCLSLIVVIQAMLHAAYVVMYVVFTTRSDFLGFSQMEMFPAQLWVAEYYNDLELCSTYSVVTSFSLYWINPIFVLGFLKWFEYSYIL